MSSHLLEGSGNLCATRTFWGLRLTFLGVETASAKAAIGLGYAVQANLLPEGVPRKFAYGTGWCCCAAAMGVSIFIGLYRKAKRSPEFLNSKKVIIWCFAAREFTQSEGWKKVPLP